MLAYDYPLLGAFWTMMILFLWIIWLFILFRVITDIFRSEDMGGGSKAIWMLFVLFLPYFGVFVYIIARGSKMNAREVERVRSQEESFRSYVRETAGGGTASELSTLADLRDRGVLTDEEFQAQKARLLS
jgi:hypothetical protein